MKHYFETQLHPVILNMEVEAYHPILDVNSEISASDTSMFTLPSGQIISRDRTRITQQMIDDFDSFMDDVETLCEVNYGLIGVYKNVSNDHSYYYNYLAKDENENIIVKFRFRLRISNHEAHRSKQQQQNKKAELQSEKLNELLTEQQIRKLRSYTTTITINDEEYASYREAFDDIDRAVERAVEIMIR